MGILRVAVIVVCLGHTYVTTASDIEITRDTDRFSIVADDWLAPHMKRIGVILDYEKVGDRIYRVTARFRPRASGRATTYFMAMAELYVVRALAYRYYTITVTRQTHGDFFVSYLGLGDSPEEALSAGGHMVEFTSANDVTNSKDDWVREAMVPNPKFVSYESLRDIPQGPPVSGAEEMRELYNAITE